MTVRDLMEILEMFDEDAEVKLAYQPSWPLCTAVASVKKKDGVVYVCESGYGGNDYAPHCLFESDEYVDLVFTDGRTEKIFSSSATRSAMNAGWMAIIAAITMKSFWKKSP